MNLSVLTIGGFLFGTVLILGLMILFIPKQLQARRLTIKNQRQYARLVGQTADLQMVKMGYQITIEGKTWMTTIPEGRAEAGDVVRIVGFSGKRIEVEPA